MPAGDADYSQVHLRVRAPNWASGRSQNSAYLVSLVHYDASRGRSTPCSAGKYHRRARAAACALRPPCLRRASVGAAPVGRAAAARCDAAQRALRRRNKPIEWRAELADALLLHRHSSIYGHYSVHASTDTLLEVRGAACTPAAPSPSPPAPHRGHRGHRCECRAPRQRGVVEARAHSNRRRSERRRGEKERG